MLDHDDPKSYPLPAGTQAVPVARRLLRHALSEAGAEHLLDDAVLATSELVTNALVHAGPVVTMTVWLSRAGVRVEVSDTSPHVPAERGQVVTSSTGRGLRLVAASSDRWGVTPHRAGKSVWFEIGSPRVPVPDADEPAPPVDVQDAEPDVLVTLQGFPILMHWAWQEHASVLLREYLLHVCPDDPSVLDRHAEASAALSFLREQVPLPDLPDDPEALLDSALEPAVTAAVVSLRLSTHAVGLFDTLDALLRRATRAAQESLFLSPPTQPEIAEMREWLCREVERQGRHGAAPTRWHSVTQIRGTGVGPEDLERRYPGVTVADVGAQAVVTANSSGIIVAATPLALEILGYRTPAELVGQRVLVVIPERYHQAHVAGTTLNATNGRDALLGVPLTVPMVRADGEEVPVELRVEPRLLANGVTVFEATLALPWPT